MVVRAERTARWPPPLFYDMRFTNKILVSLLGLLLLFGLAGSIIIRLVLEDRLDDEIAANARILAVSKTTAASLLLANGDMEGLSTLVEGIVQLDDSLAYAVVRSRDGTVLAHTFDWDPPLVLLPDQEPSPTRSSAHRRLGFDGHSYLDVSVPILVGPSGVGTLQVGASVARVARFVRDLNVVFLLSLAGLGLVGMLFARAFVRRVTRPVYDLIRLADQVSIGNLDVEFDFGVHVRCWEIKQCGQTSCAAYQNTTVQCWYVDGTPCEGYEPRFPQKLMGCRTCEVYRAHRGDEIVQLADSFRHMTQVLKNSRQELERAYQFQRILIQNSISGLIATDENDVVRIFNGVAERLTGHSEAEIVGRITWDSLFPRELDAERRRPLLQDGSSGIFGFYRKETVIHRKDGEHAEVLASGMTLRDGSRHVGKVFFFRDMQEVMKLREELVRTTRLAAIGHTVASISHSIKNILDGLRGGAYIYNRGTRLADPSIRQEGWSMVERNIDHISALVADLLNYSRDRRPELRPTDPNQLALDICELLRAKADLHDTALELVPDPRTNPFPLDPHAIHQCLTNLVTNALDATARQKNGRVVLSTSLGDPDTLVLQVRDNGPGIPQELVEQLFSAMTSTKGSKGTGLGLLVVHKIVSEHGGTVRVQSDAGAGALFTLQIPRGELPPLPAADTESTSTP